MMAAAAFGTLSRRVVSRLALACLALLATACGSAEPAGRNIVIITLDTTRADHLSGYGYGARTSPHLDALATRGILFENAYAPMPQTLPAHASMFTGLQPRRHGALENHYVLPEEVLTLAEVLSDRGYDTAGFIAAAVLDRSTGMAQGFAHFDEPRGVAKSSQHPVERRADAVTDSALAWALSKHDKDKPFLLWAHYYDAHGPYEAPVSVVPMAPVEAEVKRFAEALADAGDVDPRAIAKLWWAYANEIAYADDQMQRLLAGLTAQGLMENTVIAIVGDHGEGLLQHGEKGHGVYIYEEALKVPFVLVAPDDELAGTRVKRPVVVADLAASVLTLAGLQPMAFPADGPPDGEDLVAALRAGRVERDPAQVPIFGERPHYSREKLAWRNGAAQRFHWGIVASVLVGDDKLIRDTDGRRALYDLAADPHELRDLSAEPDSAQTLALLTRALDDWMRANPVPEPGSNAQSSDERREALLQLGY